LKEFKNEKDEITHCGRVPPADFKEQWSKPLENTGTEYPGTAYRHGSSLFQIKQTFVVTDDEIR